MNNDSAYSDGIGCLGYARRRIPEEGAPQTLTLLGAIYGETREYGNWDRIWHISPDPAGSASERNRS